MPQTIEFSILNVADQSHFHFDQKDISGTHTITGGTHFRCDSTGGSFTITLPDATDTYLKTGETEEQTERIIQIKKISADANTVTVDGNGSQTLDGSLTMALTTQYARLILQSNGTNWDVLHYTGP